MPYSGPFYFLSGAEGNVSLPSIGDKRANVAEYWSKRLGLELTRPGGNSPPPRSYIRILNSILKMLMNEFLTPTSALITRLMLRAPFVMSTFPLKHPLTRHMSALIVTQNLHSRGIHQQLTNTISIGIQQTVKNSLMLLQTTLN